MRHFWQTAFVITLAAALGVTWQTEPVYTQSISAPSAVPGINKPVRIVRGRFTQDVTLTRDTYWVLRGAVFIADGARLTIESGTTIIGETATRGTLVVERGGRLIAD